MRARDLKEALDKLSDEDLDLEVMTTDPNRSGIINGVDSIRIVSVKLHKQFAYCEEVNCNYPIGHRFIKLN